MKTLLVILALLFASPAWATTYYVATTGSNGNSCAQAQSPSTPKLTIANGMTCLGAADTLQIAAGTYAEGINGDNIPSGTNFTTGTTKLIGVGSGSTIVKPSGAIGISFSGSRSNIEFKALQLDMSNNVFSSTLWEGIQIDGANNIRFTDVVVHHGRQNINVKAGAFNLEFIQLESYSAGVPLCQSSGDTEGGLCHGAYIQGTDITFDRCSLHDNNGNGVQFYPSPSTALIKNCIIYGNRRQSSGGSAPSGIQIFGKGVKAYNNTVYNNGYIGIWCASGTGHEIKNSISYGNGDLAIFNNCGAATATNLTTDPSFVDAATNNFHLLVGSAAKDAGTNLSAQGVTVDRDSVTRPQGAAFDIGAYEYVGSSQKLNAPDKLTITGKVTIQ